MVDLVCLISFVDYFLYVETCNSTVRWTGAPSFSFYNQNRIAYSITSTSITSYLKRILVDFSIEEHGGKPTLYPLDDQIDDHLPLNMYSHLFHHSKHVKDDYNKIQ